MSGAVLAFDSPDATPSRRADARWSTFLEKGWALERLLIDLGVMNSRGDESTPVGAARMAEYMAACDYAQVWKSRAMRLEKALRNMLASDALSEEDRRRVLDVIAGRPGTPARDTRLLSPVDAEMVANYRRLSDSSRAAIRAIVNELAHASDEKAGA